MRISDWSSDVCSSDLHLNQDRRVLGRGADDAQQPVPRRQHGHHRIVDQAEEAGLAQIVGGIEAFRRRHHQHQLASAGLGQRHHVSTDMLQQLRLHLLRSEEHTSELQSLMRISYAVFCLKKKKKKKPQKTLQKKQKIKKTKTRI